MGVHTGCLLPSITFAIFTAKPCEFYHLCVVIICSASTYQVYLADWCTFHILNTWSIFKSSQSGVTLCFQFVSTTSASSSATASASVSTSAKTFPSHVKTIWAKPLIFGTKNIWVWGNVLDDIFLTLTQGHGWGIHSQKFACLQDLVRTTHWITIKSGNVVALVMVITWLDFGVILLKTVGKFSFKKVKHYFGHISAMVGPIDVKWKGSALVGYWVQYVTLTSLMTLTLDVSRSNFEIALSQELLVWFDVKWKGSESVWYWADCMTLPFDHTHDLDLGVSRSESEIALSQEWGGRLTMNEKDVSHPFMTMILTCVTVVGWADVQDSDQGDFRLRHAVDISSFW